MNKMPFTKDEAKERILDLVKRYKAIVENGEVQNFNEAQTTQEFIEPLFEALNWNMRDHNEVTLEEKISKKRADYGFRIKGIPHFFLEAKALGVFLSAEHAEQAINYSWLKDVTWAVLTNFAELKIFNAKWKSRNIAEKRFIELTFDKYYEDFDDLWLLSKDSFLEDELDKKAERYGKKTQKTPVTPVLSQIFIDLMIWRQKLTKNIMKYNSKETFKSEELLDECVQRIIDRLIFVRVCEDRELEPPTLQAKLNEWKSNPKKPFMSVLKDVFREFDKNYDGDLFSKHLSEELIVSDDAIVSIIYDLYRSSDRVFFYDFGAIDADVLGNIYEEYLGYVLKKKRDVTSNYTKRKEMGIYYTPTFVVDYIVRHTVGEMIDNMKRNEIKDFKVLDPTCGSGSFLLKAFYYLHVFYDKNKENNLEDFLIKNYILQDNLFGVDVDPKAVEIARLNLSLIALEKRRLLPILHKNIRIGNSLIDDEKVAGDRAFVWKKEFESVVANNGFDVIIGNPPYVHQKGEKDSPKISFEERDYYRNAYRTIYSKDVHTRGGVKLNLFVPYVERSLSVLKENGRMGFIVHKNILKVESYKILRKFLLDTCRIITIVDLGSEAFEEITGETVIIILERQMNERKRNENMIEVVTNIKSKEDLTLGNYQPQKIKQATLKTIPDNIFEIYTADDEVKRIQQKIRLSPLKLGDAVKIVSFGLNTIDNKRYVSTKKLSPLYKICLMGRDVGRYLIKNEKFVLYDKKILSRVGNEEIFNSEEKLVMQRIGSGLIGTYDNEQHYCFNSTNMILKKDERFDLKYILALLNSRSINYYYRATFTGFANVTVNATQGYLSEIPIPLIPLTEQEGFIELVTKMLILNKKIKEVGELSDESKRIQEEIERIDKKIDQKVYELYGLIAQEIKTVEDSFR